MEKSKKNGPKRAFEHVGDIDNDYNNNETCGLANKRPKIAEPRSRLSQSLQQHQRPDTRPGTSSCLNRVLLNSRHQGADNESGIGQGVEVAQSSCNRGQQRLGMEVQPTEKDIVKYYMK